eukprot:jgi/Astpho2/2918/fgenesh1_pg.00050_%23_160_t
MLGADLLLALVRGLLLSLTTLQLRAQTYLLHLEVHRLLLVLQSTQLYTTIPSAPEGVHPFLDALMWQHHLAQSVVQACLQHLIARPMLPAGQQLWAAEADVPQGVLQRVRSAAVSVLSLPLQAMTFLLGAIPLPTSQTSPLGDHALLLLLLLINQAPQPAEHVGQQQQPQAASYSHNPFRAALSQLRDADELEKELEGSAGEPQGVQGLQSPGMQRKELLRQSPELVSFAGLYGALSQGTMTEAKASPGFRAYLLVRSDADSLLLPLLELLYATDSSSAPSRMYMVLIILLMLSQDTAWSRQVHRVRLGGRQVSWFRERSLQGTTLGSLLVIMLLRVAHQHLGQTRDAYLLQNTLATLANLAPHVSALSSHAAQRLVAVAGLLVKRLSWLGKLDRKSADTPDGQAMPFSLSDPDNTGEVAAQQALLGDLLRLMLEVIDSVLTAGLGSNPELVYALLHRAEVFESIQLHDRFADVLQPIQVVTDMFSQYIEDARAADPAWEESVAAVMTVIKAGLKRWKPLDNLPGANSFTYEEERAYGARVPTSANWQAMSGHRLQLVSSYGAAHRNDTIALGTSGNFTRSISLAASGSMPTISSLTNGTWTGIGRVLRLTDHLEELEIVQRDLTSSAYPNLHVLQNAAAALDVVQLAGGDTLPYDKVCICSGATPKAVADHPAVLVLRDSDSVQALRLPGVRRLVLVGNGGIALELAHSLRGVEVVWAVKHAHVGDAFFDLDAAQFLLTQMPHIQPGRGQSSGGTAWQQHRGGSATDGAGRAGSEQPAAGQAADQEAGSCSTWGRQPSAGSARGLPEQNGTEQAEIMKPKAFGHAVGPQWTAQLPQTAARSDVAVHHGCEITAVRTLSPSHPPKSEAPSQTDGAAGSVELTPQKRKRDAADGDSWPLEVEFSDGRRLGADLVISAIGVTPNTSWLPKEVPTAIGDGGILVDRNMESSVPGVFAAGDACCIRRPDLDQSHWFQMRLWTQARIMGTWAAQCMVGDLDELSGGFAFELFTHVTRFCGRKVVLLGRYNGQGLEHEPADDMVTYSRAQEAPDPTFIRVLLLRGRMQGAVLIGDTDLEETFEHLILDGLDLSRFGPDLLDPEADLEDFFD